MAIDANNLTIHDEVTVEADIDGHPGCLYAFVTNVLQDELWMATRLPEPRLAYLSAGQEIHLTFDRGGALTTESRFLRRLGDTNLLAAQKSRVFAVSRPDGVEPVQRRAHVRVDLERTVRIRSTGNLADLVGKGRTVNIGAGGLLFVTDIPLLYGEDLRLALVLSPRDIIVAGGPVIRIEDASGGDGLRHPDGEPCRPLSKVAVRFDQITEADQERITCHILSAHRRRRRLASGPESADPCAGEDTESLDSGAAAESSGTAPGETAWNAEGGAVG